MTIRAERCRPFCLVLLTTLALLALVLVGCGDDGDAHSHSGDGHHDDDHAGEDHAGDGHAAASWSVTAWGEGYEIFAEAPALTAGEAASVHTHVTRLDGFAPLGEGRVEVVLRDPVSRDLRDESFPATRAQRPGVFDVQVTPGDSGERELVFRVAGPAGSEEIPTGAVRIGEADWPGRLLRAPAPRGAADGGEPVEFLKEEQWSSDFATAWVRRGGLRESARGLARLRPPAGGDVAVTAPLDAVVRPAGAGGGAGSAWPYPGMEVAAGQPLFRLLPRVSAQRSLAELESRVTVLATDLEAARARRERLEGLLEVEAVSRREVEEALARQRGLEANLEAARSDLASARSARSGGGGGDTVLLSAPIDGRVAAVAASPGASVSAGEALARVVRTDPVWVEVSLSPEAANRVGASLGSSDGGDGPGGLILASGDGPPLRLPAERVRLVSVAPEADAATGRVPVLVEVSGGVGLSLGTVVDAEVLLGGSRPGVVVPTTALVDDGGVPVVYLQLAGERFVRQEVEVALRQGAEALVEGLRPGQRLVTRGGEAIRRATLMETGGGHGHVH